MGKQMVYLDANSSSKLRPEAGQAMEELLSERSKARNPSSVHTQGRLARALLRRARQQVLDMLSLNQPVSAETIFVSGGTEACNQMMLGFLGPLTRLAQSPAHILSTSIEHAAVSVPLEMLEQAGWRITCVSPNSLGLIAAEDFVRSLEPDTAANNETGAVQPVIEIAKLLRLAGYGGPVVCDITQAVGKSKVSIVELFDAGVNAVAISGHKIGAPSGIGALIVSSSDKTCFLQQALLLGGPQEQRLRGGTENLLGIVGFGAAAEATHRTLNEDLTRRHRLREALWKDVSDSLADVHRLGPIPDSAVLPDTLLSNTLLVQVGDCRGDDLVAALDLNGLAASTGSACSSGRQEVSASVRALGLGEKSAGEVIRLSLDWDATQETVEEATRIFCTTVQQMRRFSEHGELRFQVGS